MLLFTRLWRSLWIDWNNELSKLTEGRMDHITYEDFKARSEAWIREDSRYRDA